MLTTSGRSSHNKQASSQAARRRPRSSSLPSEPGTQQPKHAMNRLKACHPDEPRALGSKRRTPPHARRSRSVDIVSGPSSEALAMIKAMSTSSPRGTDPTSDPTCDASETSTPTTTTSTPQQREPTVGQRPAGSYRPPALRAGVALVENRATSGTRVEPEAEGVARVAKGPVPGENFRARRAVVHTEWGPGLATVRNKVADEPVRSADERRRDTCALEDELATLVKEMEALMQEDGPEELSVTKAEVAAHVPSPAEVFRASLPEELRRQMDVFEAPVVTVLATPQQYYVEETDESELVQENMKQRRKNRRRGTPPKAHTAGAQKKGQQSRTHQAPCRVATNRSIRARSSRCVQDPAPALA